MAKLPNTASGRRRHYWHVFSRDRGIAASWQHEIGFDNKADALAECEDIRDAGRVPRIIPCLWTDEPGAMVAALNAEAARKGSRKRDAASGEPEPQGVVIRLCQEASKP